VSYFVFKACSSSLERGKLRFEQKSRSLTQKYNTRQTSNFQEYIAGEKRILRACPKIILREFLAISNRQIGYSLKLYPTQ